MPEASTCRSQRHLKTRDCDVGGAGQAWDEWDAGFDALAVGRRGRNYRCGKDELSKDRGLCVDVHEQREPPRPYWGREHFNPRALCDHFAADRDFRRRGPPPHKRICRTALRPKRFEPRDDAVCETQAACRDAQFVRQLQAHAAQGSLTVRRAADDPEGNRNRRRLPELLGAKRRGQARVLHGHTLSAEQGGGAGGGDSRAE
jgi:hypothetical protein